MAIIEYCNTKQINRLQLEKQINNIQTLVTNFKKT